MNYNRVLMITALYNRHRVCHRCEAGEDEDRRLDAGGGVVVQGDTGHAPHQLLRHGQADQNQDLCTGTLSFRFKFMIITALNCPQVHCHRVW